MSSRVINLRTVCEVVKSNSTHHQLNLDRNSENQITKFNSLKFVVVAFQLGKSQVRASQISANSNATCFVTFCKKEKITWEIQNVPINHSVNFN